MAALQIPAGGLSLLGWPAEPNAPDKDTTTIKRSAVLLKVNKQVIRDLQECARQGRAVRVRGGPIPSLHYGSKHMDLHVRSENATTELFTPAPAGDALSYLAPVSQTASLLSHKTNSGLLDADTKGADAALATLKQSLASFAQEKESKQATISSTTVPDTKANRILSNRYIPNDSQSHLSNPDMTLFPVQPTKPLPCAPTPDPVATQALKVMTIVFFHFLAAGPRDQETMREKTRLPRQELTERLQRHADYDSTTKTWKLKDRAYRELDVWNFRYPNDADRQSAIDNAVRAYDRLRLGKDDRLWQLLLPVKERGKGTCLSRLHSQYHSANHMAIKGHSPITASSPAHAQSDTEARAGRLTPAPSSSVSMARVASAPGKNISIEKRLKDAQKARLKVGAPVNKRKPKSETVANEKSDPAVMKVAPRTVNPFPRNTAASQQRYKSDEKVHSSDDDSDGRVARTLTKPTRSPLSATKAAASARSPHDSSSSDSRPLKDSTLVKDARHSTAKTAQGRPVTSDAQNAKRDLTRKSALSKDAASPAPSTTVKAKAEARRDGPASRGEKRGGADGNVTAKPQLSPRKSESSKPKNPSPLGRANGTSAPSLFGKFERSPPIVKKVVTNVAAAASASKTGRPAASAPPSAKKRPAPNDGESERPRKVAKPNADKAQGQAPAAPRKGNADASLKRKATDMPSENHDGSPAFTANKHRRTDSASTHSGTSTTSALSHTTTARTSVSSQSPPLRSATSPAFAADPASADRPDDGPPFSPSDSSASEKPLRQATTTATTTTTTRVVTKSDWDMALEQAYQFRKLYPRYLELHTRLSGMKPDEVDADEEREVNRLHCELERMKARIYRGSEWRRT